MPLHSLRYPFRKKYTRLNPKQQLMLISGNHTTNARKLENSSLKTDESDSLTKERTFAIRAAQAIKPTNNFYCLPLHN